MCVNMLYAFSMNTQQQKDIVFLEGNRAMTTTLIIAEGCGIEHRAVMQLLKTHKHRQTLLAFQMSKVSRGGRPVEYATLTERQTTFLITLMRNSETVVLFKERLSNAFHDQRETISRLVAQRKDSDWQNVRKDGKHVYFQKTDVIKQFVDYAKGQGSQSAERYYCNLAKMENKALFFFEQRHQNMREVLTIKQLMQVSTADGVVEKALQDGMTRQLPYKDCYKLAKERIIAYAEIIGQSPVLALVLRGPEEA